MTCSSCGHVETAGAHFCGKCGAEMLEAPARPSSSSVLVVEHDESNPTCTSCGHVETAGARFCGECGADLVEPAPAPSDEAVFLSCSSCGAREEDPSSRFCGACGAALDAAPGLTAVASSVTGSGRSETETPEPSAAPAVVLGERPPQTDKAAAGLATSAAARQPAVIMSTATVADRVDSPPGPVVPPAGPDLATRRSSLVLVLVGAGVLVAVVAVVGGVFALRGGSSSPSLEEQTATAFAPVSSSASQLQQAVSAVRASTDFPAVGSAAASLGSSVARARSTLSTASGDDTTKAQLDAALQATGAYASAVQRAAADPSPLALASALEARSDAEQAFVRLNARDVDVGKAALVVLVPLSPLDQALAREAAAQARIAEAEREARARATAEREARERAEREARARAAGAAAGTRANRAYVTQIDQLLTTSAETRQDLGRLIAGVQDGSIPSSGGTTQIASILRQREELQGAVGSLTAPAPFARSAALLRSSIAAAIADDQAIQQWISARGTKNASTIDRAWSAHLSATAQATLAKQAFVDEYDKVRSARRLGKLRVGTSY